MVIAIAVWRYIIKPTNCKGCRKPRIYTKHIPRIVVIILGNLLILSQHVHKLSEK